MTRLAGLAVLMLMTVIPTDLTGSTTEQLESAFVKYLRFCEGPTDADWEWRLSALVRNDLAAVSCPVIVEAMRTVVKQRFPYPTERTPARFTRALYNALADRELSSETGEGELQTTDLTPESVSHFCDFAVAVDASPSWHMRDVGIIKAMVALYETLKCMVPDIGPNTRLFGDDVTTLPKGKLDVSTLCGSNYTRTDIPRLFSYIGQARRQNRLFYDSRGNGKAGRIKIVFVVTDGVWSDGSTSAGVNRTQSNLERALSSLDETRQDFFSVAGESDGEVVVLLPIFVRSAHVNRDIADGYLAWFWTSALDFPEGLDIGSSLSVDLCQSLPEVRRQTADAVKHALKMIFFPRPEVESIIAGYGPARNELAIILKRCHAAQASPKLEGSLAGIFRMSEATSGVQCTIKTSLSSLVPRVGSKDQELRMIPVLPGGQKYPRYAEVVFKAKDDVRVSLKPGRQLLAPDVIVLSLDGSRDFYGSSVILSPAFSDSYSAVELVPGGRSRQSKCSEHPIPGKTAEIGKLLSRRVTAIVEDKNFASGDETVYVSSRDMAMSDPVWRIFAWIVGVGLLVNAFSRFPPGRRGEKPRSRTLLRTSQILFQFERPAGEIISCIVLFMIGGLARPYDLDGNLKTWLVPAGLAVAVWFTRESIMKKLKDKVTGLREWASFAAFVAFLVFWFCVAILPSVNSWPLAGDLDQLSSQAYAIGMLLFLLSGVLKPLRESKHDVNQRPGPAATSGSA